MDTKQTKKVSRYDQIIDEHLNRNLFDDRVELEKERVRMKYRVPENEKYQDAGIKAALMLQFEPFFSTLLLIGIYIGFTFVTLDLCVALSSTKTSYDLTATLPSTLYNFDIIYLMDIVLMHCYKRASLNTIDYIHSGRHTVILSIELFSVVPFEVLYLLNAAEATRAVYCSLRMRYALRLIRVAQRIIKSALRINHILDIIGYVIATTFSVLVCSVIDLIYRCRYANGTEQIDCDNLSTYSILRHWFRMSGKITGIVLDEANYNLDDISDIYSLVTLAIFFVYIITMGRITFQFIQLNIVSFQFTNFHEHVVKSLYKNRSYDRPYLSQIDKLLPNTMKLYISMLFDRHVKHTSVKEKTKILPDVMNKEITCDIYWDALKHVHLFPNMSQQFMRYVSTLVVHHFYTDGEPIFTRSEIMSKMVYILNGVVKVHSEVNGETPIICFTNGTVLGATTLALSRTSTTYVTCHNFCETIELHRRDFVDVCVQYPEFIHSLEIMVKERCDYARRLIKMTKFQQKNGIVHEQKDLLSIRYIKHKLRVLLSKDLDKVNTQQIWSYDDQQILENEERSIFCSEYICKYVITTDQDLNPDLNFMRKGVFFKFRPESPVLFVWNIAIVILTLLTAAILPYYCSFVRRMTPFYMLFITVITISWLLDTVLQLLTGVVTADRTYDQFVDILKFRIDSVSFFLDCVACIPYEAILYILEASVTPQAAMLLQLNRILKMYRFTKICNQSHWSSIGTQIFVKYFKYITLFCYWVFFIAAIVNLTVKFDLRGQLTALENVVRCALASLQFLAGVDIDNVYTDEGRIQNHVIMCCLQLVIICIKMYIISDLASAEALSEMRYSRYLSFCASLRSTIKCFNVDRTAEDRLWAHVQLQWSDNKAQHILRIDPLKDLSTRLHKLLNYSSFGHHLSNMELLQELPEVVIRSLCIQIDVRLIPANEVITYLGDNAREMYLVLKGYCGRLDYQGKVEKLLSPGSSICVLETLHGFRCTSTIKALTDVKVVVFERNKFISEMTQYPDHLNDTMETLWCSVSRADLESIIQEGAGVAKYRVKRTKEKNFYHFGFIHKKNSKEYNRFRYPFPRRLLFLRYLVFRTTFANNGKFLIYYEYFRCICAYLTCLLGSSTTLTNSNHISLVFTFGFLDATAWIDICLRHYFCYYDSNQLQETHPANTVFHYWTHAFLLDLLAVFPFNAFVNDYNRKHGYKAVSIYIWNRCLQLYRPYHFKFRIKIVSSNSWVIACLLDFFQVLLVTILVFNVMSLINNGFKYTPNNLTLYEEFNKEMEDLVIIASLFLNVGYKPVKTPTSKFINITLIWMGHIYIAVAMAKAIGISLFCNVDINIYQGKMRSLVKFLNYRRIDKKLKYEIIHHFEHIWLKRRGMLIQDSIDTLNTAFREDILYEVYGSAFKQSTVFPNAPKAFIQTLLLSTKHMSYLKRAIIYRVNDIHGFIGFIFKGQVEVLGPDNNKIALLPVGSFFGCLDRCAMTRQTLTIVAKGHCEILTITSLEFHKILENYREQRNQFREKTSLHVDYLHGSTTISSVYMTPNSSRIDSANRRYECSFFRRAFKFLTMVNKNIKFSNSFHLTIAIITFAYFVVEMYQKVTLATHVGLVVMLYISDGIMVYKIYAEFHIAVQDDYGNQVTSRHMIAQTYRRNFLGLYFDLFTVIPVEIFFIPFLRPLNVYWTICRTNRPFRILIVFHYIYNQMMRLNVNVYLLRTTLALLVMFTIQQLNLVGLVQSQALQSVPSNIRRYLKVNAYSIEMIFMVMIPSSLMEGPVWYKIFIVIKMAYLRICLLYFISACSTALFMSNHNSFIYWRFQERLTIFMKRLKVSQPLYDRVVAYINLFWLFHKGIQFPQFLEEAPYYLREAVLYSMFGYHIERQPLLGKCHVDLVRQMVAMLRTRTFFPGDFITFAGDVDECMYFLHQGEIVVLSEDNLYEEIVEKTLHPGDMFGLRQGFLKRIGHDNTYRATKYTIVLVLKRSTFINFLDFFPASKRLIFDHIGIESKTSLNRYERSESVG